MLFVFAGLGVAVWLFFRDEALKPADDLMPRRPAIAWDDNNGWKRLAKFSIGLPPLGDKALLQIRSIQIFEQEPAAADAKKWGLDAAQLTELESMTAMPRFHARVCADLEDVWDEDVWAVSTLKDRFVFTLISATEEGDTALFLRALKLSALLQKRLSGGATSLRTYIFGVSWISDAMVARSLMRLPWSAAELRELADALARDPVVLDELHEAMRHEFQLTRHSILTSGDLEPKVSTGPGPPPRWLLQKNRTANLLADAVRRNSKLTLVTPWSGIVPAPSPSGTGGSWLNWINPNWYGEFLVCRHGFYPEGMDRHWRPANGKRRAMQVIVALHRYHQAHGAPPADISALVPDFLPAVPLDPFDFAPLRWHPALRAVHCIDLGGTLHPPNPKQVKPVSDEGSVFLFRTKAEEDARRAAVPPAPASRTP